MSSSSGAARSPAPPTGASTSASSAPTGGGAPASPVTGPGAPSSPRSPDASTSSAFLCSTVSTSPSCSWPTAACFGALAFDLHNGGRTAFLADAVVLCGGGHTRLWRRSSSRGPTRTSATASTWRSLPGLRAQDIELVQFHPTGMVPRGGGGHAGHRGGARRGRPPAQRGRRAVHGALRPGPHGAVDARPRRARELHRDRRGPRRPERRRLPRHHPPRQGLHPRAAAAHVPPVHRVPDARHLNDADGGRADRALHDGRDRGRSRDARHRRRWAVRGRRVRRRACTARTGSAATR